MIHAVRRVLPVLLFSLAMGLPAADFDIRDEAVFKQVVPDGAKVEKLAGEFKFLEGPVWNPAEGGALLFSDIPNDRIMKWTQKDGLSEFRKPSRKANGNYLTPEGLLVSCEHDGRRVSITRKDGTVEALADRFDGKKFSSPNDVVVKSDGTVYFTDPPYGLPKGETKEQDKNGVYRVDPKTHAVTRVADDFDMPNGLCFTPDEKQLYIADSGKPRHVRLFDLNADGTLANGKIFCAIDKGAPDGIRCDAEGRFYSSADHSIQIFDTTGKLLGKILFPETPANMCFGGADRKRLFVCARTGLYAITLSVAGAQKP